MVIITPAIAEMIAFIPRPIAETTDPWKKRVEFSTKQVELSYYSTRTMFDSDSRREYEIEYSVKLDM